jgi:hypothetical protein
METSVRDRVFKIGEKVLIPLKKSVGSSWLQSHVILQSLQKNQDCLYVVNISEDERVVELHIHPDTDLGEKFLTTDIQKYVSNVQISQLVKHHAKIQAEINGKKRQIRKSYSGRELHTPQTELEL